ncbi:hypothetical protein DFJ58DRAFT_742175 [Suillus subalutaceus]|uniref:uncharacterized protein n=1 Tax=Suillus subalutaceus TaxID=48586 RepID=UPI001B85BDD7|nr:uncharacterized protein DFJ58DRAFT_742175 [Suillus subalutaceus]KAG1870645.1 hypothetical protein DFJ58DRAFT_742175 [Suillus subalutaceus]
MRFYSLVAALSLGSAALALRGQFPVNTADEIDVQPLDTVNLNVPPYSSSTEQWRFEEGPPENATGNLIFDTVHSLLQQWPNTRYRNGHNIVPGVIPTGTLLYHGTDRNTIPSEPDWTATDPEHSINFVHGRDYGSGWHLTLAATRPLNVLYFDGSSAAKISEGTMDTQDIIAWGEVQAERYFDERRRIKDLCRWGKEFGIDGFARMEMDFEVMLCDFTAGVEVVSFLPLRLLPKDKNPSFPRLPSPPSIPSPRLPSPPRLPFPTRLPFPPRLPSPPQLSFPPHQRPPPDSDFWVHVFEVMHSGSWHNRYPGDSRIVLDLTGLISLYDIALAPSLVPVRAGLERWDHRVLGISSNDISKVMRNLTEVISRPHTVNSGIDWKTLIHVIVDRYADRLELMDHLLNFTSSESQEVLQRAKFTQTQLRVMLTPYLLDSIVVCSTGASGVDALRWASPIFRLCATTHTSVIVNQIPFMTPSEHLLLKAVEETTREICRVTTKMWAVGVMSGLDTLFPIELDGEPDVTQIMNDWKQDIQKLMSWLDWSIWIKCQPGCGPEEMCYLPTWPENFPKSKRPPPPPPPPPPSWDPQNIMDTSEGDYLTEPPAKIEDPFFVFEAPTEAWRKPQPKCIRRLSPYRF